MMYNHIYEPRKKGQSIYIDCNTDIEDKNSALFEINRQIDFINYSLTNFDFLSNIEKFRLILLLYSFDIHYKDLMTLVNYKYNKGFSKIHSLSTTIEDTFLICGCSDKYGITFDCATIEDFLPEERRYSFEEINALINEGVIYPLFARAVLRHSNFNKDEIDTQLYYDAGENDYMCSIILENNIIDTFVPNDIKLSRDSGCGNFYIDEKYIDENSAILFMKLYGNHLTKTMIFNTAKEYILQSLELLNYASYYNASAEILSAKIKKYYDRTFMNKGKSI